MAVGREKQPDSLISDVTGVTSCDRGLLTIKDLMRWI